MSRKRLRPDSGQESVWDYPRPPRLERSYKRIQVIFNGVTVADTTRAYRVLETSHPPVYYLPPADVHAQLIRTPRRTVCEFKGAARYFTLQIGDQVSENAAWSYPSPAPAFSPIRDFLAFYPSRVDAGLVNGERVTAQAGDFYGGWITADIVGPFKGGPGTGGW